MPASGVQVHVVPYTSTPVVPDRYPPGHEHVLLEPRPLSPDPGEGSSRVGWASVGGAGGQERAPSQEVATLSSLRLSFFHCNVYSWNVCIGDSPIPHRVFYSH